MDAKEFQMAVDQCFERIASWLEEFDPDELDFSTGDGVLKFEFANGTTFVLSRQAASFQIWLAAGVQAWHFEWEDDRGAWFDDRDEQEFYATVSQAVSQELGRAVEILV